MEGTGLLLNEVVPLTFPRLRARLKLGKKHCIESSPILQVENFCRGMDLDPELESKIRRLVLLNRELKLLPSSPPTRRGYKIASDIIKLAFELTSTELFAIVERRIRPENNLNRSVDGVRKIGQYYRAVRQLVLAATGKKRMIFRRIEVLPFQIKVPCSVRVNSKLGCSTTTIQ